MKIAFVSPRYPAEGAVGGCETLLSRLAHHARAHGLDTHFLTTCATNHFSWENTIPPGTTDKDGLPVHFFPVDEDRDIELFLSVQSDIDDFRSIPAERQQAWIRNSVNSRALIEHLVAGNYDAAICGPYLFGITHAVAEAVPGITHLVPCLHDESYAQLSIMGDLFRKVRGLLFNAEPERQLAIRLYDLKDDAPRQHVVGMGLEPFESDGPGFRQRHGLEHPYVIFCGRREPGKGTPLMLDFLQLFRERTGRDISLVLTGTGDIHPHPDLKSHILDLGYVDEQEKRDAMAGALAFIHPSVNESFGIVLLESFLAGRPGLVHAGSDVLKYQCATANGGLWFRHYPEFEVMLTHLLDHPDEATALGTSGRAYVHREYSWDAVGRRLFDAIGVSA